MGTHWRRVDDEDPTPPGVRGDWVQGAVVVRRWSARGALVVRRWSGIRCRWLGSWLATSRVTCGGTMHRATSAFTNRAATGLRATLSVEIRHRPQSQQCLDMARLMTVPDGNGPNGVKGLGEIGIVGTAAAIANAVSDATGRASASISTAPSDTRWDGKQGQPEGLVAHAAGSTDDGFCVIEW
jgi:hypothetical protein